MSRRLRLWPWMPLITERNRFLITIVTTDNDRKGQLVMELNSAPGCRPPKDDLANGRQSGAYPDPMDAGTDIARSSLFQLGPLDPCLA